MRLKGLRVDAQQRDGLTALDLLDRRDVSSQWIAEFSQLLDGIIQLNGEPIRPNYTTDEKDYFAEALEIQEQSD